MKGIAEEEGAAAAAALQVDHPYIGTQDHTWELILCWEDHLSLGSWRDFKTPTPLKKEKKRTNLDGRVMENF